MKKILLTTLALAAFACGAGAQVTLTDLGGTAAIINVATPTPGPYDIYDLSTAQYNDGLNYYFDNSTPPGQTFTTESDAGGYTLTNLCINTAGGGGNSTACQGYHLYIYSVSTDGTTATLLATYTGTTSFIETHWINCKRIKCAHGP